MNPIISVCPVCTSELVVERLHCQSCDTVIEGTFEPVRDAFSNLSKEQMQFVLNFIRCEGRFNRLEEELKLSYPTLRNRLNDIVRALGFEPGKEDLVSKPNEEERRKILESLEKGELDINEVQRRLAGLPETEN